MVGGLYLIDLRVDSRWFRVGHSSFALPFGHAEVMGY